ncbi:MAG: type II toxin-antitoxin system HipA family toxin [Desulfohalobiaceae bacterium]
MIHVLADRIHAGALERNTRASRHVFTYHPQAAQEQAVSLTMPVRLQSYVSPPAFLHPIFDMNLPEGYLRSWLTKAIPNCDDLKLLQATGPSQLGRLEYRSSKRPGSDRLPEFRVADILTYDGARDLFQELLSMYARASGVSGVQPKVLVRDPGHTKMSPDHKIAVRATTHIVKTWDNQYPHLTYNEHFCLLAARYAGLSTPYWEISENGKFLVVERFDLTEENRYLGFEDFCVLAGLPSAKKYQGSYEQLTKVLKNFLFQEELNTGLADLFKMIALCVVLRNGDAHRKNFCLIYNSPELRRGSLAPTFDVVTTTAYLPNDVMALTMDGSKRWPHQKRLLSFARNHCGLQHKHAVRILEEVKQGVSEAREKLKKGIFQLKGFSQVGRNMLQEWEKGLQEI